jgi:hypothetical protein
MKNSAGVVSQGIEYGGIQSVVFEAKKATKPYPGQAYCWFGRLAAMLRATLVERDHSLPTAPHEALTRGAHASISH